MLIYMAEYSYIYPYMQTKYTQQVCETYLQYIHTQETGACYTQLTKLQCSTTQLLFKGLQRQSNYPAKWQYS